MAMDSSPSSDLLKALEFLMQEYVEGSHQDSAKHRPSISQLRRLDTWGQLSLLKRLLCVRSTEKPFPLAISECIDSVFSFESGHRMMNPIENIPILAQVSRKIDGDFASSAATAVNLSVWKGDITSLSNITAIVNAANPQMLGCFQPDHKCIDNVIHTAAGPGLRAECREIMSLHPPATADGVIVTKSYHLPSKFVIHVAGPQLRRGSPPTVSQIEDLKSCYISILNSADELPLSSSGRKSIAIPCISTGLYAFPPQKAASIAFETVLHWISEHPDTRLTDITFDVFTNDDYSYYYDLIVQSKSSSLTFPITFESRFEVDPETHGLSIAKDWLQQADNIIISAGAGLSAAAGLDYTSTELFRDRYGAFLQYGIRRLYDTIGFDDWPSPEVQWGFYFYHLALVRNWPRSELYAKLLEIASSFGSQYFVRTSNADGLFAANRFEPNAISTPQGQYKYLQCLSNCRVEAIFPTEPFLDAALPFLDPDTGELTDSSKIPRCAFCNGDMMLCVRAGNWFNEKPFEQGEIRWRNFLRKARGFEESLPLQTVILELGVGLSTPGVLRLPNERLAQSSNGNIKLIRAGVDAGGSVSWDLERQGVGVGINGDLNSIITALAKSRLPAVN